MNESQKWLLLILLLIFGGVLYLLAPVLTPFLIAGILAYIGDPLVDRLEAARLSRALSVTTVFLVITLAGFGAIFVFLPMLEHQVALLMQKLPHYIDWMQSVAAPWLQSHLRLQGLGLDFASLKATVREHWTSAGGFAAGALGSLSRSGLTLLGWLANLVLVPVVTFYLLRDWDVMMGRLRELLPRRIEAEAVKVAKSVDEVLGAFLRGQLTVMLALGVIYTVGLWLVGLDLALLIGMLAGLVSFVPYLGPIVGVVVAGTAALMQFQELTPLVYVALVFGVGQLTEGMVLTPLLLGDRIGLHPVAVMFAVLAGGQLFGFFGVLLALPVAAVIAVLLRYTHERYVHSQLYRVDGSEG